MYCKKKFPHFEPWFPKFFFKRIAKINFSNKYELVNLKNRFSQNMGYFIWAFVKVNQGDQKIISNNGGVWKMSFLI